MKILNIIQSRSSSKRLPNKSILPIKDIPNTVLVAKRCNSKKYKTIVATSNHETDDLLVKILKKNKINFFRGSLFNVKDRFLQCTKKLKDDCIIIRLTADNTFVDKNLIEDVLKEFKIKKKNYIYIDNKHSKLPYGISVEVFKLGFLRKNKETSKLDKEHVTYSFPKTNDYKYGLKFKKKFINLNCTLDTPEDYKKICEVFSRFKKPEKIHWLKLCNTLKNLRYTENLKYNNFEKIIIGSAQFGSKYGVTNLKKIPYKDINKILNFCIKLKINQFDTAQSYFKSEKMISKLTKIKDIKLDTKIYLKNNNKKNLINKSLKSFKGKKINILYLHGLSKNKKLNLNILQSLKVLKNNKKISFIGVSIDSTYEFNSLIENYLEYIDVVQIPFNLLENRWDDKKLKIIKKSGIKIFARSIYLQGLLTGEHSIWNRIYKDKKKMIFKNLNNFIKKTKRLNYKDLSVAYLMSNRLIDKYILGINSFAQLTENLTYFSQGSLSQTQKSLIKKSFKKIPVSVIQPSKWKV